MAETDDKDIVLVVDDDPQIARLLDRFLTKKGVKVITADNGLRAVELCRQSVPNLVLLDIIMPGLGGTEVLRILKREHPNLPVIFITAVQDEMLAKAALAEGAMDYLCKPFDFNVVERAIAAGIAIGERGNASAPKPGD